MPELEKLVLTWSREFLIDKLTEFRLLVLLAIGSGVKNRVDEWCVMLVP